MFWKGKTQSARSEPAPARRSDAGGYLGHYGLTSWWRTAFSAEERAFLEAYLAPILAGDATWYEGTPPQSIGPVAQREDAARFLSTLAGFLKRADRAPLAVKLLDKGRQMGTGPLNEHFLLMTYIEARYKSRNSDPQAIPNVIEACQRAISIAPLVIAESKRQHDVAEDHAAELHKKAGERFKRQPFSGVGNSPFYHRLAIILRRQGRKEEAAAIEARHETEWLPHTIDYRRVRQEAVRSQ